MESKAMFVLTLVQLFSIFINYWKVQHNTGTCLSSEKTSLVFINNESQIVKGSGLLFCVLKGQYMDNVEELIFHYESKCKPYTSKYQTKLWIIKIQTFHCLSMCNNGFCLTNIAEACNYKLIPSQVPYMYIVICESYGNEQ